MLTIAEVGNNRDAYFLHKVIPDGHCYINCYLEACSNRYQNEPNKKKRRQIAIKTRLDFANYLVSTCDWSKEKVSSRLNIINPTIMIKFFRSSEESFFEKLTEACHPYNEENDEFIYERILALNLLSVQDGRKATIEYIRFIYTRDHRVNMAISDNPAVQNIDFSVYGVGRIPLNINFYKICHTAPSDYTVIESSIRTLIDHKAFLESLESTLIAKFMGLNSVALCLGFGYQKIIHLTQEDEQKLYLLLINIDNRHWDMISFNDMFLLGGINENILEGLFSNLNTLYKRNKI